MGVKQKFSLGAWLSLFQIRWFTLWRGRKVGVDAYGNAYYVDSRRKLHGHERRWVIFNGENDASKVPPEWHGWLHYSMDAPLSAASSAGKTWIKPHVPNLTGTRGAYYPSGHQLAGGVHPRATGDYEPWSPPDGEQILGDGRQKNVKDTV